MRFDGRSNEADTSPTPAPRAVLSGLADAIEADASPTPAPTAAKSLASLADADATPVAEVISAPMRLRLDQAKQPYRSSLRGRRTRPRPIRSAGRPKQVQTVPRRAPTRPKRLRAPRGSGLTPNGPGRPLRRTRPWGGLYSDGGLREGGSGGVRSFDSTRAWCGPLGACTQEEQAEAAERESCGVRSLSLARREVCWLRVNGGEGRARTR